MDVKKLLVVMNQLETRLKIENMWITHDMKIKSILGMHPVYIMRCLKQLTVLKDVPQAPAYIKDKIQEMSDELVRRGVAKKTQ